MKLLIVTGIFPPDIGGPATYVPTIAHALIERGHDVCVLTLSDRHDHQDGAYAYRLFRIKRSLFKPVRWVKTVAKVVALGRSADVLFACGLSMETVLANLILRKPLVMRIVGDLAWERATLRGWTRDGFEAFQQSRQRLAVEVLRLLQNWWVRMANRVVVPSSYLAGWVMRWGVKEECLVVIPNSVDLPKHLEPEMVDLHAQVKAVTVGRLIPHKRVDGIIEAIRPASNLGLVVIGDGSERAKLEQLTDELGLRSRVLFAGRRSHDETMRLMRACDFFVLNSTYEGLPHVVIEAMSLGLPVVATATGGTVELVSHQFNGLLVETSDALRQGVGKLAACSELRAHLAQNGLAFTRGRFEKLAAVDALEEVFARVGRTIGEPADP